MNAIRVLSVDDHPLLREGIAALIAGQPDMQLAAEACTGIEAIERYRELRPDITLLDIQMPLLAASRRCWRSAANSPAHA